MSVTNLYVATPTVGSHLCQFEFLLTQAAMTLVGEFDEDEDDASDDSTGDHHEDA